MKPKGPPILPMYKVAGSARKKNGGFLSVLMAILLPLFAICLLVFFFLSIYMGSYYLQEHLQDESSGGVLSSIGLPNTRNIIQKWSIANLHGVDLTKLGPPPKAVAQGMGGLPVPYYHGPAGLVPGNWSSSAESFLHHLHLPASAASAALQNLTHHLGSAGSAHLRGWLGSAQAQRLGNASTAATAVALELAGKAGKALRSVHVPSIGNNIGSSIGSNSGGSHGSGGASSSVGDGEGLKR